MEYIRRFILSTWPATRENITFKHRHTHTQTHIPPTPSALSVFNDAELLLKKGSEVMGTLNSVIGLRNIYGIKRFAWIRKKWKSELYCKIVWFFFIAFWTHENLSWHFLNVKFILNSIIKMKAQIHCLFRVLNIIFKCYLYFHSFFSCTDNYWKITFRKLQNTQVSTGKVNRPTL